MHDKYALLIFHVLMNYKIIYAKLFMLIDTNLFEILPVRFYVSCNDKKNVETASMKQNRLQKATEYKKRKKAEKTESEKQIRLENSRMY